LCAATGNISHANFEKDCIRQCQQSHPNYDTNGYR